MVYNILYTIIATVGEYVIGMLFSGKSKIQELISYTVYITTLNGRLHEPARARTVTTRTRSEPNAIKYIVSGNVAVRPPISGRCRDLSG